MINLMHGDCLELMKDIPDGSVDLILCDLPYGTTQNKWDAVIPFDRLWPEYWRVLKANGVAALTASQPFTSALVMSQVKRFKHEWVWIKNRGSNFANTVREPFKEHESVLIFSPGKWTYNKQMQARTGGGLSRIGYEFSCRTDSDNYGDIGAPAPTQGELRVPSSHQKFNTEVGLHPTQKPVSLYKWLLTKYAKQGDRILDTHLGSGSIAIACHDMGFDLVGCELDTDYYNAACKRLADHQSQMRLL